MPSCFRGKRSNILLSTFWHSHAEVSDLEKPQITPKNRGKDFNFIHSWEETHITGIYLFSVETNSVAPEPEGSSPH
jgi:hypothetical protein